MIDLSISIVNHNNKECLRSCLDSIYSDAPKTGFEVTVVDNGSSDGSVDVLRQAFPLVNFIENPENRGFVKANNQGIRASRGRYLLSLNNDTIIRNGTLGGLVRFMEEHPDVGVCGPKVLNQDGTLQLQCRRSFPTISSSLFYFLKLHRLFPRSERFGRYLMTQWDCNKPGDVDSVSGCCLMVRREVIEQVGALDENFIMYGDDLDWCYRIKQSGWRVCYVPDVQIVHLGGQSSRRQPRKCVILFYRAMAIFYRKHYAPNHNFVMNYVVYAGIYLKAAISLCINTLRREKVVGSKKPCAK
ncbi:MAG: glycosyltransferase family 2 protein [Planctomycetota bacterium]|jgi:GT2 family glycosyltransferase